MTAESKSSVVVLTYNCERFIEACLASLMADESPEKELLVIDNASRDRTVEIVREKFPRVRLIANECNLGVAGGWNQGWKETSGAPDDLVVFLNPDLELHPGWLRAMQRAMRANPRADVAGARLLNMDRTTLQHCGGIILPNMQTRHRGAGEPDRGQYAATEAVPYVTGAAIAVRRSAMEALGGFDEDYYPAYFEEMDFCWRVRKLGREVLYVHDAIAWHHEVATLGRESPAFHRMYFRMRALFAVKNLNWRQFAFEFRPYEKQARKEWSEAQRAAADEASRWVRPYIRQRAMRKLTGRPGRPCNARPEERPCPKIVDSPR